MCITEGCNAEALYNEVEEMEALYCNEHKSENMVIIINSKLRCLYDGCYATASYNYDGKQKGLYCNIHKLKNMVNNTFAYL